MTMEKQWLQRVTPKHREIARRLLMGQNQREVARDLAMTESRLSIIVNSPLFKLMKNQMQLEREARLFQIEKEMMEGAARGLQMHRQVMENQCFPVKTRLQSAALLAGLGAKMVAPLIAPVGNPAGASEVKSYEEMLGTVKRKVTIEEEVVGGMQRPAAASEDSAEEEVKQLEDVVDAEVVTEGESLFEKEDIFSGTDAEVDENLFPSPQFIFPELHEVKGEVN